MVTDDAAAVPESAGRARAPLRVVISNGFGQFHLRQAATETARRGALAAFITGGYPTPAIARALRIGGLDRIGAAGRLLARGAPLPTVRVRSLWAGEPFGQVASRLRRLSMAAAEAADRLDLAGRRLYSGAAARIVARLGPAHGRGIYHYRAGFGGDSVNVARRHGWLCLCDHSIAHPAALRHLVAHEGRLPPRGEPGDMDRNWRAILADIKRADHIVVNSEFVRSTFLHNGEHHGRISVVWLGIGDEFLSALPPRRPGAGPIRMLFAGSFCRRKGGPVLAEAWARLGDLDCRLDLCGSVEADAATAFARLASDRRVTWHGTLSASELGARMAGADIFVFPTLADGSARVVLEALATGCYVVTTPNAGSIVADDGRHGRIVAPGSVTALVDALREAAGNRARAARIGARAAALVRRNYRQAHYGTRLLALYEALLDGCTGGTR